MAKLQPRESVYVKGMSKDVRKYNRVINRCLANCRRKQKANPVSAELHAEVVAEYMRHRREARWMVAMSKKPEVAA